MCEMQSRGEEAESCQLDLMVSGLVSSWSRFRIEGIQTAEAESQSRGSWDESKLFFEGVCSVCRRVVWVL